MEIEPNEHVILEIGTGETPFPAVKDARIINKEEHYIGVERDHRTFLIGQRNLEENSHLHKGKLDLLSEDVVGLSLDGCIDEIVMCNFFGQTSNQDEHPEVVRKARSLIREDGILIVVETTSPHAISLARVRQFLLRLGFGNGLRRDDLIYEYVPDYRRPFSYDEIARRGSGYAATFKPTTLKR